MSCPHGDHSFGGDVIIAVSGGIEGGLGSPLVEGALCIAMGGGTAGGLDSPLFEDLRA